MPTLKQKGKIPIKEEKTTEVPKLKSKMTIKPKEKEPEMETIQLKKVPVKPPEPKKQVVTHKAEVIRHHDPELSVRELHDREEREIITLGRIERVFTAEQGTVQLSQIEETETIKIVQTTEKEGWTRTTKPKTEEEPEVPSIEKKKIKKLPKTEEQQESVKLKPFEKPGKLEQEQEQIKLKQVPSKPKELEKEISKDKTRMTKQHDAEPRAQKTQEREDREMIPLGKPERVSVPAEEPSKAGQTEKPEQPEEEEKSRWTRTTKAPKEGDAEPDLSKKKIKKLPKKDEESEVVTLKPFEKPTQQEASEQAKTEDEGRAKTDTERSPFKLGEMLLKDQPTSALKNKEDKDVSLTSSDTSPDITKSQPELPQKKKDDQVPKDEETTATDKLKVKPKVIPKPQEKEEQVVLKPFTKVTKPEKVPDEQIKKPVDTKVPDKTTKDMKDTEKQKPVKKEEPSVPAKKPSPTGLKEKISPTEAEKFPAKPSDVLKKDVELKKTPSPMVSTEKAEDKKPTKPVEEPKKIELKKTPPSKVEKQKDLEKVPAERKPSSEKVKEIPKAVSPKDSVEAITLKKVPKKPSVGEVSESEKPDKGRIPLSKEISPGAVQMKRVTTQPEEEVFKNEPEEGEVEEESWGWDLVPSEDWEGEEVDGALETPGMPGARRGEMSELFQLILEPLHPIPDLSSNLHHIFFDHFIHFFISC